MGALRANASRGQCLDAFAVSDQMSKCMLGSVVRLHGGVLSSALGTHLSNPKKRVATSALLALGIYGLVGLAVFIAIRCVPQLVPNHETAKAFVVNVAADSQLPPPKQPTVRSVSIPQLNRPALQMVRPDAVHVQHERLHYRAFSPHMTREKPLVVAHSHDRAAPSMVSQRVSRNQKRHLLAIYTARVRARVKSAVVVPVEARELGLKASVLVEFKLSSSGRVIWAKVARSSGIATIDHAALGAIRGAHLPPLPTALHRQDLTLDLKVSIDGDQT